MFKVIKAILITTEASKQGGKELKTLWIQNWINTTSY